MEARSRQVSLAVLLAALSLTLLLGFAVKVPCASGDWADGRQYRRLCYSDIVPLYATERLAEGKFPYLEAPNEYPVGTGMAMALTAWPADGFAGFFLSNAVLLSAAAVATAVALYAMVGSRALYLALAPTVVAYAFLNWDLLAVALATLATAAYLSRRDVPAGILLGLGAATKLYPGFLVVPFALGRFREGEPDRGVRLTWAAAGAWLAANLPFALLAPGNWWTFFRFNTERPANWDSLWFIGCHRLTGQPACEHTALINALSLIAFLGGGVLVWRLRAARARGFPAWTFGFPLLIVFLLANKVYSPQYSLWLLPWFALVLPDLRLFAAFQAADVAVFVTEFSWLGRFSGVGGLPLGAFEIAFLLRSAVLLACLAAWVRRAPDGAPPSPPAQTFSGRALHLLGTRAEP